MVRLAQIFSDGAILQRNTQIRVFGECDKAVTVTFDKITVKAECKDGKFCAVLPPHEAGTGYTLTVTDGEECVKVEDVACGEVFIAAGQSNMEMPLAVTDGAEDELEHCENPQISFYSIPQNYVKGENLNMFRFQYMDYSDPTWKKCTYDTAKDFSALGYYVAKKIQKALGVPVGVIGCNWGCRLIESFIPKWAFDRCESLIEYKEKYEKSLTEHTQEEFDEIYENFKKFLHERYLEFKWPLDVSFGNANYASYFAHAKWVGGVKWPQGPYSADRPGHMWHNMLEDIVPYSIKFVFWCQGEGDPRGDYGKRLIVLMNAWKEAFCQNDIEFYAIEHPPYGGGRVPVGDFDVWPLNRESLRKVTLEYPGCHLVTGVGLGDIGNVHPIFKRQLGYRAARKILHNTYGVGPKADNPYAVSASFEKDCVRVKFANDEGLRLLSPTVEDLYLSVDGKDFVRAAGRIENGELVVTAKDLENPIEVCYCYSKYFAGENIFNSAALPASPFRFVK